MLALYQFAMIINTQLRVMAGSGQSSLAKIYLKHYISHLTDFGRRMYTGTGTVRKRSYTAITSIHPGILKRSEITCIKDDISSIDKAYAYNTQEQ
jgi:hypothetical protein